MKLITITLPPTSLEEKELVVYEGEFLTLPLVLGHLIKKRIEEIVRQASLIRVQKGDTSYTIASQIEVKVKISRSLLGEALGKAMPAEEEDLAELIKGITFGR